MPMTRAGLWTVIGLVAATVNLSAHERELVTPDRLWRAWTFAPWVIGPLLCCIWLYWRGVARLWARAATARVVSRANVLCFAGGVAAVAVALVSPLDALGGTLLSAHMAQHGLLAGLAPPLLLMGRPGVVFASALRPLWSADRWTLTAWRSMIAVARWFAAPAIATVMHAVMLWLWHAPLLFGAAVASDAVHALQHLCFFAPSLFFWHALLDGDSPRRAAIATAAAFLTFMHTGLLGGLLTMAPEPLYPSYFGRTESWGVTALDDQHLAGLLMWIPMGLPYLAAGVWLASRVLTLDAKAETGL